MNYFLILTLIKIFIKINLCQQTTNSIVQEVKHTVDIINGVFNDNFR